MDIEQITAEIINNYSAQIWISFVTLVVTGLILIVIKNFIQDIFYYIRARMSDIGFGQRILWKGEIFIVQKIHFKYISLTDDKKNVRIPISTYIEGVVEFPIHRFDDFDEKKYFQAVWDGHTERRESRSED